ncbi:Putative two-component sensor histidine kinase [Gilliamella apicola]|uniref:sensor histidine kinase n=1 Tax=Gilliamella apicola TaxID=1196095 RepID=UPI00042EE835|nr:HAMP domain-containing sensor histidine kinase [Gilliamella apicola]AHN26103.1 Putative two-component sensor histidine kinase [Gilliamella apicola]PXV93936.1 phospho-acceptor domain-containing protein [Gilliamella apicola]
MKKLTTILSLLILMIFISYLGWRSVEHEVLLRENNETLLAKSRINNINLLIESLLNQRLSYLSSLSSQIDNNHDEAEHLLEVETDIKNIFIINKNKILFLSDFNDSQWHKLVESIALDNSLILNLKDYDEQFQPNSGWYQNYDHLIYWFKVSDDIIGFELSTIKLTFDIINLLDNQSLDDNFKLINSDKQIYSNGKTFENEITESLKYPLQNWNLTYYYSSPNLVNLYILGIGGIALFILVLFGFVFYGYREYTRTLRLAKQQVTFVGQVSHEFKTPLTNITLYSEMLSEYLEDEAVPIPDYLQVISAESKRLTRLIQNVLTFNKSNNLNIKPVNLTALLKQVYLTFKPILAAKSLQLNLINLENDCIVNTDADSVMQILNNFLSNAEKYASKGKQVDLSLCRSGKQVVITVRDYGEGVATHLLKQIFKPFYRVSSSITEGVSGTGIGLTIANQLAKQLQGEIKVVNQKPGIAFSLILME